MCFLFLFPASVLAVITSRTEAGNKRKKQKIFQEASRNLDTLILEIEFRTLAGGNTKEIVFGLLQKFQYVWTSLGGVPFPKYRTIPPRTGCVDGPQLSAGPWRVARFPTHWFPGRDNSSLGFLELREHRWTLFPVASLNPDFRDKGTIWSATEQGVHFCSLNSSLDLFSNQTSTHLLALLFFFEGEKGFLGYFRE